jgi:hypothetical protein
MQSGCNLNNKMGGRGDTPFVDLTGLESLGYVHHLLSARKSEHSSFQGNDWPAKPSQVGAPTIIAGT